MGTKQRPGAFDCHAKALPDEPMFVLLARDPWAPYLVDVWAGRRMQDIEGGVRPRTDEGMVVEALACADAMRAWREANDGKWRHKPTLTREQVIERLTWIATAKPGDPLPEWMNETGGWGYPLSTVAASALAIITKEPT